MKRAIFKVLAVFVTVVAVAMMGAALAVFFVHPDVRAEMNTPAMLNYTFAMTAGETPQWTVTRRFSTDPTKPQERNVLGTYSTAYDAIIKAHSDLKTYLTQQTGQMVTAKTTADEQRTFYSASQEQDTLAIATRIQDLKTYSDEALRTLQVRSEELQALSVKSTAIREETENRRTDVDRLSHELDEARTDLFRLNAIRRDLTDRLVRLEIENQELISRKAQVEGQSVNYEEPPGN